MFLGMLHARFCQMLDGTLGFGFHALMSPWPCMGTYSSKSLAAPLKPETLNPKPYNLNPKPKTLKPKP